MLHRTCVTALPSSQSAEAHTTKAFETAIAVDPLFTKTGAQFDEGGAKGTPSPPVDFLTPLPPLPPYPGAVSDVTEAQSSCYPGSAQHHCRDRLASSLQNSQAC